MIARRRLKKSRPILVLWLSAASLVSLPGRTASASPFSSSTSAAGATIDYTTQFSNLSAGGPNVVGFSPVGQPSPVPADNSGPLYLGSFVVGGGVLSGTSASYNNLAFQVAATFMVSSTNPPLTPTPIPFVGGATPSSQNSITSPGGIIYSEVGVLSLTGHLNGSITADGPSTLKATFDQTTANIRWYDVPIYQRGVDPLPMGPIPLATALGSRMLPPLPGMVTVPSSIVLSGPGGSGGSFAVDGVLSTIPEPAGLAAFLLAAQAFALRRRSLVGGG